LISADGEQLQAQSGATLDAAALAELGLAKREAAELFEKLAPLPVPDFELDLSRAASAESFAERFAQAVPKVDKKPVA
jgi:NAD(P)-dependent dehydrogenase (short-subunit alcohol dehydrogenase family)